MNNKEIQRESIIFIDSHRLALQKGVKSLNPPTRQIDSLNHYFHTEVRQTTQNTPKNKHPHASLHANTPRKSLTFAQKTRGAI
jgi:hypothetical protein